MKCLVTRASLMTRFIQKIITSTSNRPLALKKRLGRDFHALNGRRNWNGFTQTLTRRTIGIYGLRNWAAAWKIDNRQNLRPAVSRERIFAEPSIERQSDKLYSATESNGPFDRNQISSSAGAENISAPAMANSGNPCENEASSILDAFFTASRGVQDTDSQL